MKELAFQIDGVFIIEPDFPYQYRGLLPQLHRVYLDELSIDPQQAIGVNIAELVIANEDVAIATAKSLIAQTSNRSMIQAFSK